MMTNTSPLVTSNVRIERNAQSAAAIFELMRPKVKDVKEDRVAQAPKSDRMAWVNHLIAIRDEQDRTAFAEVFAHFAPRVKGFLMKSGEGAEVAEEISQDVMATLWRKAHMFDPTKASVATWIFTIARNRRIDVLRKQRRPEPEDLTWGPQEEPDQADVLALQQESALLGVA